MSLVVGALYAVQFSGGQSLLGEQLVVPVQSAVLAAVTAIASTLAYVIAPKTNLHRIALTIYILLVITIATLLHATGVASSPFVGLGMLVGIFAGLFGLSALLPLLLLVNGYAGYDILIGEGSLTSGALPAFVLAFELPLIASYLIWHSKSSHENEKDKAYNALAHELSQVSNKSDIVINAIADGVVAVDGSGVIQLINPAAQAIIGWGKQDAVGLDYKSVLKILDHEDKLPDEAVHPVAQVLKTAASSVTNDFKLETISGKKLLISLSISPAGQVGMGAIVVFRDITKEKAEERQQFEFVSTASHEMRTPVASIEGYLGLALNPATATVDEKARSYIGKAHESAQHLGRLFQDLLDVTKADDGRLSNNPKVVDVVAFTSEIITSFDAAAQQKGLVLLFKPLADGEDSNRKLSPVYYVEVDNDHLREVLGNLIENGLKYTKAGNVTVDVTGDSQHVVISVHDTGIGIRAEDLPHLFQKFYRIDNTDTREIGGTGLGLYLSKKLVEAMDGRLSIESEYGRGSTFLVELKRLPHEEAIVKIEQAATSQPQLPPHPVQAPQTLPEPATLQPAQPSQPPATQRSTINIPSRDQ